MGRPKTKPPVVDVTPLAIERMQSSGSRRIELLKRLHKAVNESKGRKAYGAHVKAVVTALGEATKVAMAQMVYRSPRAHVLVGQFQVLQHVPDAEPLAEAAFIGGLLAAQDLNDYDQVERQIERCERLLALESAPFRLSPET